MKTGFPSGRQARHTLGAHVPARGHAIGGLTAPMLFSGRLKRRCNRRNAVTLAHRGGEHVGDEEADGLRPLILVGACGTFVAALRHSDRRGNSAQCPNQGRLSAVSRK
jgi:hypothetical protein